MTEAVLTENDAKRSLHKKRRFSSEVVLMAIHSRANERAVFNRILLFMDVNEGKAVLPLIWIPAMLYGIYNEVGRVVRGTLRSGQRSSQKLNNNLYFMFSNYKK